MYTVIRSYLSPPQTISVRLKYWARYSYIEWWGKIVESESRLFRWIKTKSSGEGSIGDLCAAQTLAAGAGCDAASPQGTVVRPCLDSGSAWLADERRGEEVREGWELDGGRGLITHVLKVLSLDKLMVFRCKKGPKISGD